MDVYIKPVKKVKISGRKIVYLRDIAEIYSPNGHQEEISSTIVLDIKKDKQNTYLISVMDVIKQITNKLSELNITVNNVGEMDTIVEYAPKNKTKSKVWEYIKVVFISITLFMGAATAIMSFHSDAEMPQILRGYYTTFYGEKEDNPLILEIPYSLGLGIGIILFFNHFSKIKLSNDPTPLEVQMTTYEQEVINCLIDNLDKEKQNGNN